MHPYVDKNLIRPAISADTPEWDAEIEYLAEHGE